MLGSQTDGNRSGVRFLSYFIDVVKTLHKYLTERKQIEENKTFGILKMQNNCAEFKIRAERKAGEFLKENFKHGGDRKSVSRSHDVTLKH